MKPETLFGPFFSAFSAWIRPLPLIFIYLSIPSPSLTQPLNYRDVADINPSELLRVSSDQEATSLFKKTFGPSLGMKPLQPGKRGQPLPSPHMTPEITDEISQFMAQVIISFRANRFPTIIESEGLQALGPLSNRQDPQSLWLTSKAHTDELNQFMELTGTIVQLSRETAGLPDQPPSQFSTFARHFDQTYPHLVGGQDSWVSILQTNGTDALIHRFHDYWEDPSNHASSPEHSSGISPDQQQAYAHWYVKTRLLPVFVSHLIAQSIQVQANAESQAGQSWSRLRKWNETNQQLQALTRLCGKWQWTVHNHQNHQDHKMTLSFSPVIQQIPGQPQPDVIIMNGDTVYLKWTFPSGYQEDSLLLSNRDQRLEGTFKNSRGPHGSISGKRLSNCSR